MKIAILNLNSIEERRHILCLKAKMELKNNLSYLFPENEKNIQNENKSSGKIKSTT